MQIHVDIGPLQSLSKQLKSLNRSAYPVAVRKTLNDLAFDVKLKSMPKSADRKFKKRQPNFFKANSKVVPAIGFKVNSMRSEIGFFSNNLRGKNNAAVKDLEEQEHGGTIEKKSFIAEEGARQATGLVKANRRLGKLPKLSGAVAVSSSKGMVRGRLRTIKSKKQQFIRAAFVAKKKFGGFVLGNRNNNGSRTLSIITAISKSGGGVRISRSPLYNVKNGRAVRVGSTQFMKRATYESALNANQFFIQNAQKQFLRHLSKK